MSNASERERLRLGLIGLMVFALVAALVAFISRQAFGTQTYTAELEHTGGLRVGEEVQVAGVGVGEVTEIALVENNKSVRVSFTLDDGIRLGDRTEAEVKVATLLGTHFLMVKPAGKGELRDDTIAAERTSVPYNLQDALDDLVPEVKEFDTSVIEKSMAQMAETLEASGGELGPALAGVRSLSEVVVKRSEDLGALLRAARRVTAQLNSSGGDLVTLMKQADLILDTLRTRRETLHALFQDLTELGQQLQGLVKDTEADIGPTLRDLDTVVAVLQKHDKSLKAGIRNLAPAARYFANAGGTGGWLDQYTHGATPDNVECHVKRSCR